jgi:hypothetical protein
LITSVRSNMKNRLMPWMDKIMVHPTKAYLGVERVWTCGSDKGLRRSKSLTRNEACPRVCCITRWGSAAIAT